MYHTTRLLALLTTLGLCAGSALPQELDDPRGPRPRRSGDFGTGGFWPTPKMMELFIDRLTDEMSNTYKFDEDQLYNTRELIKERFPGWFNEHRGEIMQLTNEYFEALLEGEAPTPELVAHWAQRVLPLFDEFTGLCEETCNDMRVYLTDEQQAILDGQLAAFRIGAGYMSQRLGGWSEGLYDPETEWPRNPNTRRKQIEDERKVREQMAEAERQARGEAAPATGTPVGPAQPVTVARPTVAGPDTRTKDDWTRYTEDFIRRYKLDEDQQARAHKALKFALQERERYVRRSADKIAEAEKQLKEAKTDDARRAAEEAGKKLTRPVERMFTMLKDRLDQIPTRAQRVAAAQSELERAQPPPAAKAAASTSQPGAKKESPGSP